MKTKSHLLILFLAFLGMSVQAQEGEIIFTDFEPDLCVSAVVFPFPNDTIKIDFDQNGIIDYKLYLSLRSTGEIAIDMVSSWDFRPILFDDDSIVPTNVYWNTPNVPVQNTFVGCTHTEDYLGFRKSVNDEFYYAWIRMKADIEYNAIHSSHGIYDKVWAYVDCMAYCTIPNYPLRWGQTDITGVEENSEKAFATIHPNPASATLTITGENLKQIEITNMLGQCVATHQAEGTATTIDISSLPTGIYLATITDENGRRCVRKVVKE